MTTIHHNPTPGDRRTAVTRRAALAGGAAIGFGALLGAAAREAGAEALPTVVATGAEPARPAERVSFPNGRGGTIVAHLRPSASDAVVVMAHGWQGNKSSRGRFDVLSAAFNTAGYATLALDFAGCGESSDDVITMVGATDDLRAAMRFAEDRGYGRICLYGNSWGSHICLRAFDARVHAVVLTGALTHAMHYAWSQYYAKAELEELRQTGVMTVPDPEPIWRQTQQLSQQSLDDYAQIDQAAVLGRISTPVLILHGNDGWEERTLLRNDQQGFDLLPQGSRIVIFDRVGHSLGAYLGAAGALATQWFGERVPVGGAA